MSNDLNEIIGNGDDPIEPIAKTITDEASPSVTYICRTYNPNANTSDPEWQIKRVKTVGDETTEDYADNGKFNQICDNRASLFGDDTTILGYKNPLAQVTDFNETLVTQSESFIDLQSAWGISDIRDVVTVGGVVQRLSEQSTTDIEEIGGEIVLKSDSAANIDKIIESIERHQYFPGAETEIGMGIRIISQPTGTDEGKWLYFNTENGFGFGINATDLFIFRLKASSEVNRVYRTSFNVDKLDGNGPSGIEWNQNAGIVYKAMANLYGYGNVRFYAFVDDEYGFKRMVLLHILSPNEEILLEDPNQPLTVKVLSGSAPGGTLQVGIGARQSKVLRRSEGIGVTRALVEEIFRVKIPRNLDPPETWVPVMSFRKKQTFKGKPNSVRSVLTKYSYETDQPIEIKVANRTETSGLIWQNMNDVPPEESSIEVKKQDNDQTMTSPNEGVRFSYDYASTGNEKVTEDDRREFTVVPVVGEMTVYARLRDPNVTNNANLTLWCSFDEKW